MPPKTKIIAVVASASRKKYKKFTLNELSKELDRLNKLEKKQSTEANVIRINVIKEMVEDSKVCKNQKKKEEPLKIKKPAPKKEEPKKEEPKKEEPKKEGKTPWDSVKDLNWKENVRTKILTLFNTGNRVPANKKYYIIKSQEIKGNKLIIKYVFTRERAEEILEREQGEGSEEEVVKLMTKPTTGTFTIPKK